MVITEIVNDTMALAIVEKCERNHIDDVKHHYDNLVRSGKIVSYRIYDK